MLQSCYECLQALCNAGCTYFLLVNNTPVCCGSYEYAGAGGKSKK
jgi:hypothetical protein